MSMPKGIKGKDNHVLKVVKSLYGDRRAPRLWFEHLTKGIKKLGFKSSTIDHCLYLNSSTQCAVVFHVDDCMIFANEDATIGTLIQDLKANGYDLDVEEGSVEGYLGITVKTLPNGSLEMLQ